MWIMVSGPYTAGAPTPEARRENLRAMNRAAVALLRMGHTPVIGVNAALPMIEAAGDPAFDEIMMPLSLALAERCDACLRIGGPSKGADQEADAIRARGKPVYARIEDVPPAQAAAR
jgi:hypothetical protein